MASRKREKTKETTRSKAGTVRIASQDAIRPLPRANPYLSPDLSGKDTRRTDFLRSTTGGLNFGEQQPSFQYRELLAKREVFKKPRAITVEGSEDRTR
jgi:hypothetical protein